jgi:hypothetical protein
MVPSVLRSASLETHGQAIVWHAAFLETVGSGYRSPHVSFNAEGEVVLEWWAENRRLLTVYIGANGASCTMSSGAGEHGAPIDTPEQMIRAWRWLGGEP